MWLARQRTAPVLSQGCRTLPFGFTKVLTWRRLALPFAHVCSTEILPQRILTLPPTRRHSATLLPRQSSALRFPRKRAAPPFIFTHIV